MRGATVLFVILFFAAACREEPAKPLSEPGERLYSLRGVIVSRNTGDNSLRLKHEEVAGFMAAMTMDFSVRGADVQGLPADGKRVEAKLHVTDRAFWITDVTPIP
jgi:Cu/Ag efflux protein CusF